MASSIWCNEADRYTKSELFPHTVVTLLIYVGSILDYARILWYIALTIALAAAVYIFLTALEGFSSNPAFTALKSVKHPIVEVPFPAVAICGVNKISKQLAWEYAEYLWVHSQELCGKIRF